MGPGPGPWVGHARHFHHGIGWGGWVLWILLTVAFWALVIMAVIWLVRTISAGRAPGRRFVGGPSWVTAQGGPTPSAVSPAEQILGERFARGEIDENEYRSRLAVLRGGPPPTAAPPAAHPPENPPPAT